MENQCSAKLRRFIFFRFNAFAGFVSFALIFMGVLGIQIMVEDHKVKMALTIIFLAIALLVGMSQLLIMILTLSSVINPIEQFFQSIRRWGEVVDKDMPEGVSLDDIRTTLNEVLSTANNLQNKLPHEINQLRAIFVHTLKTMESAWLRVEADTILLGMGRICSQTAHDMRGPLTAMKLFAQMVPVDPNDVDMLNFRATAQRSCERLNSMAEELLEYRKAGAVELKPTDLSAMVAGFCRDLEISAKNKHVQIHCQVAEMGDLMVDGNKLSRVMQNLIQNSIQAVEKQGDGKVSVSMEKEADEISLSIRDNGPGFPQEHMDKMFNQGFTTKGRQGNGLGLIYCANVVKGHGGKIVASNHPDGGAQITISLPLAVAH